MNIKENRRVLFQDDAYKRHIARKKFIIIVLLAATMVAFFFGNKRRCNAY